MVGWKTKCLFLAGRTILAKLVLNSLPIFHMQTTLIPASTMIEINKYTTRCVWEAIMRGKGYIGQSTLRRPKQMEGLNLKQMHATNVALWAKLGWHILQDQKSTWRKVIREKYRGGCLGMDI